MNDQLNSIISPKCSAIDLQKMSMKMKADGVPVPTISYYNAVLSSMFSKAIHWQLININPCKLVEPPDRRNMSVNKHRRKIKFFTFDQANLLLEYLDNGRLYTLRQG
jgi:hypothetical protein